MELSKNHAILIAFIVLAGTLTTAAFVLAWPALTPSESPTSAAAGADGMRIHVVQPPKAAVAQTGLLDVGLSDAALAMTKGRQALTESFAPTLDRPAARRGAPQVIPVLAGDDEIAPADPIDERSADERWERERWARENAREAQRSRWERQRLAEEERQEQAAFDRERLEQRGERDADDRYDPPPPRGDDRPAPERW